MFISLNIQCTYVKLREKHLMFCIASGCTETTFAKTEPLIFVQKNIKDNIHKSHGKQRRIQYSRLQDK